MYRFPHTAGHCALLVLVVSVGPQEFLKLTPRKFLGNEWFEECINTALLLKEVSEKRREFETKFPNFFVEKSGCP